MGATIFTWPSTGGVPTGMTTTGGVGGVASANFPASVYYPVADANAGNWTTDNTFYYGSTTGNIGSAGRVTGSALFYSSNWSTGFGGLNLGNVLFQIQGVTNHVQVVDGGTSVISPLSVTLPASGLLLLVGVVPASGLQVHLAASAG